MNGALTATLRGIACVSAFSVAAEAIAAQEVGRGGEEIDVVIVTAQRRAEDVQSTPIAMSVVSGEELAARHVTGTEEILRDLPGVEVRKAPPGASIYIRGIATQQGGGELDPGIAFSVDGVYHPFIETSFMSFYDVERVEVLKGPQGTLYGRNAIAGAVNVITRSPKLGEVSGFTQVGVGDYDTRSITAALNVPLAETLALRVAGDYQYNSGFLSAGSDDLNDISGRAKLLWRPTDRASIEVRGEYGRYDGKGQAPVLYPFQSDPWTQFATPEEPRQTVWLAGGSAQGDFDFGPVTLTYIPGFKHKKFDSATDSGGTFIRSYVYDEQNTQELRLASNDSRPLSWILGGYYYRGTNDTGLAFFTTIDQHVVTTSYAGFGQATWSLADRFRLTGGLRFTRDEKTEKGVNTLGGRVISTIDNIQWNWNNWTWRAGIEIDTAPQSMLYGNVSTGFKAGGTSLVAGASAVFDPEKLTAYEIGWKNRFPDNALTLNLAAYYYDYSNYQASFVAANPAFGGAVVRRIANAGDAKIKGAEAELAWHPTRANDLRATVAYIHGRFGSYVVPTPIPGVNSDYSGSRLGAVPWAVTLSYGYELLVGEDARLTPSLAARYNAGAWRDARQYATAGSWGPAGTYANPVGYQDSFVKLDALVSLGWHGDRYRLSGFVKNITNKAVFTGASVGSGGGSAWLEPPRTVGATFNVNW